MDRAYSLIEIKGIDEETRTIEGTATTPATDRVGDIVESMGAKFALPLPLLWQHDASHPIGHVTSAEPDEKGIPITAVIAKIEDDGELKKSVDKAWHAIKNGLVRGLSIGFRVLDGGAELMKDGGLRIKSWEWMELSAVTIPANSEATISRIKSMDTEFRAAIGTKNAEPAAALVPKKAHSVALIGPRKTARK